MQTATWVLPPRPADSTKSWMRYLGLTPPPLRAPPWTLQSRWGGGRRRRRRKTGVRVVGRMETPRNPWSHAARSSSRARRKVASRSGRYLVEDKQKSRFPESLFQDIDLLQKHGINVADIKKLKSVGICTVKGIQMTTRRALCNVKGLSEAKVDKIKEAANKLIEPGFLTAFEYSEKRKMVFHITTGSQEFDKLLGGGIESMAITEAFGEFRTGKTQLAHTLCVTAQLPGADRYTGGKIIFIDTENTFRPDRLRDIADRFNVDHDAVLDNVLYARAYTSEHQMELLDYVAAKFHEEAGIFKLLIIDSIMALFRVDFSGRGELAERQQKLAQMLSRLQKISEEYNVAVFVSNQMTADPGATMTFQADPKKPIGGHILAHASTTRISLRKGRGELRIAKIYDSPEMPENEATFAITAGGIGDAKE
ncbi:meiotic recombination protein DMC1/LIM15 homolog isoform X1 [Chrysemys picta bellii]|uniref:meiotic recombination protein DMC1/LIM15 homolog isoform X1 n=1 Tax=Chrysemys picta bellii TaxID=8478 RepID=UPI0032B1AD8F